MLQAGKSTGKVKGLFRWTGQVNVRQGRWTVAHVRGKSQVKDETGVAQVRRLNKRRNRGNQQAAGDHQ